MIADIHTEKLRILRNSLKGEGFRFILIDHNRYSLYTDIAQWTQDTFPDRKIVELRFTGKSYREIIDNLNKIEKAIVLIPDFDWLFREENGRISQAFNQRRDYLAQKPLALICFLQPSNFRALPVKMPDWWSLRSMEIELRREEELDFVRKVMPMEREVSSLGGFTKEEKEAEIGRVIEQIEKVVPDNSVLREALYHQLGILYDSLAHYEKAIFYMEKSLLLNQEVGNLAKVATTLNFLGEIWFRKGDFNKSNTLFKQSLRISREIGDRKEEGTALNNISQIFQSQGEIGIAKKNLQKSLEISQEIGNREGERTVANNIGSLYLLEGDIEKAFQYFEQVLDISRAIGDKKGIGTALNNISHIFNLKGDTDLALSYLKKSLKVKQEIGDIYGTAVTLGNMGIIFLEQRSQLEKAINFLIKSYSILKQIGSPEVKLPETYLNNIKSQIGEARFNEIVSQIEKEESAENSDKQI